MQPEVFKCRKGKSWWYANGCSQVLGVFVCWISRRRGFPQPSVEPMRKKVDARVRTLVFAWVFDAKIQLVRWPRWKEFCDRFAIYLATPQFALPFFRFLEVLEGSSDASINGNVEKWYPLHTEPSIASRSMDKKTSLRVCRSRMASSPTQGACLSLQLGYECFGRWVWTCSDPKCGIYCNLDIILMGETMMNKEILGLSNFQTHPDATFPLVSTIPLMRWTLDYYAASKMSGRRPWKGPGQSWYVEILLTINTILTNS